MKIAYFELICLLIVSISVGGEINLNSLKNPELTINWFGQLPFGWVGEDDVLAKAGVTFRGEDILLTPLASSLLITCSAHYPIRWDYDNSEEMTFNPFPDPPSLNPGPGISSIRMNGMSTYRVSVDFNRPSSYKYYAFLSLTVESRFITNNYTCVSMTNETLRITRYVFWTGQESDLGIGILPSKSVMADSLNQTLTLPCSVSDPTTAPVYLFKENPSSKVFEEVRLDNKFIRFDPTVGFILQIQELTSASVFGTYKCVRKGYVGDSALVVYALPLPAKSYVLGVNEKNTLNGTSLYAFYHGLVICCFDTLSKDVKPVKVYVQNCRTKFDCRRIRGQLQNVENMYGEISCQRAMIKPGQVFGVFRCVGADMDVTREYYLPLQGKHSVERNQHLSTTSPNTWIIDDEISKLPPETFVSIKTGGKLNGSTYNVLSKMTVRVNCCPSTYLFTSGVRWSIEWSNGTIETLQDSVSHLLSHPSTIIATLLDQESSTLELKFDKEMKSITCHAPLLNSTEWVNKTLMLNVTDPAPPKIKGPDFELLTWTSIDSNKLLVCESDGLGIPNPVFSWIHPWTANDDHYNVSDTNTITAANDLKDEMRLEPEMVANTSIIRFKIVRPFMAGIYTCILHNALGEARKLFQVNVIDYSDRFTNVAVGSTMASPGVMTSQTEGSYTDLRTIITVIPLSQSTGPTRKNPHSALVITTSISISVTLLLAGCGAGCVYILRRFKRQGELNPKPQQSTLSRKETTPANAPNIPYEELFSL